MRNLSNNAFVNSMILKNDYSAAFCLLARDCENSLHRNISYIEEYRSQFRHSIVIIIENDSIDGTKEIIKRWEQESEGVIALCQNHPEWSGLDRVSRIAHCRNEYMNILREQKEAYDYVIVIDMDVELCNVDFKGVINKAPSDFSALFANGRYYLSLLNYRIPSFYYDLYAYVPYNSPIIEFKGRELGENGDALERLLKKQEYVLCNSAFGGLAIYRTEAIQNLMYRTAPNHRSNKYALLCEHVLFNAECSRQGSLYIARNIHLFYAPLSWKGCIHRLLLRYLGKQRYGSFLYFYYVVIRRIKDYDTPKD
jgi:hypothetical protein